MIDTAINYIGQPVSLFGAWMLVMPLYVIAVIALTTSDEPAVDPEPDAAEWPADEWPADEWPELDQPQTQPAPIAPPTQPIVATRTRSFRLGDDEITFRFRDGA